MAPKRPHPILLVNRVIADVRFIVALNAVFLGMFLWHVPEEKFDISMSWATMVMDQIIISAGWIMAVKQQKHSQQTAASLRAIERRLAALETSLCP